MLFSMVQKYAAPWAILTSQVVHPSGQPPKDPLPRDGNRPAFFQEQAEPFQCTLWLGNMFAHETDKDMIERLSVKREMKDIPLAEGYIGYAFLPGRNLCPLK